MQSVAAWSSRSLSQALLACRGATTNPNAIVEEQRNEWGRGTARVKKGD
jgi:hypothetical protein